MLILKKQRNSTDSPVNGLALHSECKFWRVASWLGLGHARIGPHRRNRATDNTVQKQRRLTRRGHRPWRTTQ
jgi:hypothetical protein